MLSNQHPGLIMMVAVLPITASLGVYPPGIGSRFFVRPQKTSSRIEIGYLQWLRQLDVPRFLQKPVNIRNLTADPTQSGSALVGV